LHSVSSSPLVSRAFAAGRSFLTVSPALAKSPDYSVRCGALAESSIQHIPFSCISGLYKQAKDTELINYATDIRLRAERRAGELLREMAERGVSGRLAES
jgi:hypothetical protein